MQHLAAQYYSQGPNTPTRQGLIEQSPEIDARLENPLSLHRGGHQHPATSGKNANDALMLPSTPSELLMSQYNHKVYEPVNPAQYTGPNAGRKKHQNN